MEAEKAHAPEDPAEPETEASDDIPETSATPRLSSRDYVREETATHTFQPMLRGRIFHHRFWVSSANTRPAKMKQGAPTTCRCKERTAVLVEKRKMGNGRKRWQKVKSDELALRTRELVSLWTSSPYAARGEG